MFVGQAHSNSQILSPQYSPFFSLQSRCQDYVLPDEAINAAIAAHQKTFQSRCQDYVLPDLCTNGMTDQQFLGFQSMRLPIVRSKKVSTFGFAKASLDPPKRTLPHANINAFLEFHVG
jgi:hypothetical protein